MDRLVTPYRFEDAPSVDRAEARALDEIARFAPGRDAAQALRASLSRVLHELRGEDEPVAPEEGRSLPTERITIRSTGLASRDDWTSTYSVRIVYGLAGTTRRAVLEIPLSSARTVIARVVGVSPARLGASDLLTPVEQGILAFFAERLAGAADPVPHLSPLLPLTVLDIVSESASFPWGAEGAAGWYAISGSALVVGANIPFRLLVPWAALRAARLRYEEGAGAQERARARSARVRGDLSTLRIALTGRIGKTVLRRPEIEEMEPGDVVLLEEPESWPRFESGRLGGTIRLAFEGCEEGAGSLAVDILEDAGKLTVAVRELTPCLTMRGETSRRMAKVSEPKEAESTDVPRGKSAGKAEPRNLEAAALADEAPVQIRVELGRVRMTVAELAELAPGAILELRKDPEQPVSLFIEDRVIARGELVRIEGELGVRISSLH